jgi:hypothetical protein
MKILITENILEKVKYIIKREGINTAIQLMGGINNFVKIMGYDDVKSYTYVYLNEKCTPDNGWKDSEYYIDYVKRYGTYQFKVNGEIEYTYTMSSYRGVTTLHILSDLFNQISDIFGEEENWIDIFKDWFEDKTNMAVDDVI